jgi:hypothetical protein
MWNPDDSWLLLFPRVALNTIPHAAYNALFKGACMSRDAQPCEDRFSSPVAQEQYRDKRRQHCQLVQPAQKKTLSSEVQ